MESLVIIELEVGGQPGPGLLHALVLLEKAVWVNVIRILRA